MRSDEGSSGGDSSPRGLWLIAAVCGVVLIQVVYAILVFTVRDVPMEVRGQFGDLFGAVNALFTGLAFAGVIASAGLAVTSPAIINVLSYAAPI